MDDFGKVGIILGVIVILIMIFLLGYKTSSDRWEFESVERGHAEYYLDENYNRKWGWRPDCNSKWGKENGKEEKVKSTE